MTNMLINTDHTENSHTTGETPHEIQEYGQRIQVDTPKHYHLHNAQTMQQNEYNMQNPNQIQDSTTNYISHHNLTQNTNRNIENTHYNILQQGYTQSYNNQMMTQNAQMLQPNTQYNQIISHDSYNTTQQSQNINNIDNAQNTQQIFINNNNNAPQISRQNTFEREESAYQQQYVDLYNRWVLLWDCF
jgi:hypothetical protein